MQHMNSMIDWILDVYKSEDIEIIEPSNDAYSYLENGESVMVFKNPFNEDCNLYIFFLKRRYTVIFGNWSCHFDRNLKDEKSLIYTLELILDRQAHVLSISSTSFTYCCLCYKNRLFFSTDASGRTLSALTNQEFLESCLHGNAVISKLFWEKPVQTRGC